MPPQAVPDHTEVMKSALQQIRALKEKLSAKEKDANEPIAIIGMACRFPAGIHTTQQYWQFLCEGGNAVTEVPATRWNIRDYPDTNPYGAFLENIELFEPQFFNISPREAVTLDPQQRLLLETSWEALENANIIPAQLAESTTGVFIGIAGSDYDYLLTQQANHEAYADATYAKNDLYERTGVDASVAAGRLSYILGLQGPCLAVDTACSSSLVAVHLACQSLRLHESSMALAGGVSLMLRADTTQAFTRAGMLAPDGKCKTFDVSADGYVRGEGCGIIVLKRLSDAQKDQDTVLAVIAGSMVNHDGASSGLTAPRGPSQTAVIQHALKNARLKPNDISYIEAHGTGTALGDPVEVGALSEVFRHRDTPLWLGSVKTNIGHLETAAGVASLMKTVLMLQHRKIPPHLHFKTPNQHMDSQTASIKIPLLLQDWNVTKRHAGISSFGYSGTNAHIILSAAPEPESASTEKPDSGESPFQVIGLSARTEASLEAVVRQYRAWLASNTDLSLGAICHTHNTRRTSFPYRLAITANSTLDLLQQLQRWPDNKADANLAQAHSPPHQPPVKTAFLFTGQGSQYPGMARQLYQQAPVFRAAMDRCEAVLQPLLGQSLLSVIYSDSSDALNQTAFTQPALFAIEYALAQLWLSWGVKPDYLMGHSVGEYVAACIAGVFTLEDGLRLIAARGRLIQALPNNGGMLAILASEEEIQGTLAAYPGLISLAAVNAPEQLVIAGEKGVLDDISQHLQGQGIQSHSLSVSHAFHSPLMRPMLGEFRQVLDTVMFSAPRYQLVSNLTAEVVGIEITKPDYWIAHILQTVQFSNSIQTLENAGVRLFIEIGPKPILCGLAKQQTQAGCVHLASLRANGNDWQSLMQCIGELYVQGIPIDWRSVAQSNQYPMVALPTYPFQRKSYWMATKTTHSIDAKMTPVDSTTQLHDTNLAAIIVEIQELIAGLLDIGTDEADIHTPFLELGSDSIIVMDAIRNIEQNYGLKLSPRQFFGELNCVSALASYLCANSVKAATPPAVQQPMQDTVPVIQHKTVASPTMQGAIPPVTTAPTLQALSDLPVNPTTALTDIGGLLQQQLNLTQQVIASQLAFLRDHAAILEGPPGPAALSVPVTPGSVSTPPQAGTPTPRKPAVSAVRIDPISKKPLLANNTKAVLKEQQQEHLNQLIREFNQRTRQSKESIQKYRLILADSRTSVGFRPSLKEMLYPLVGERAEGAHLWDIDGNEYIDYMMGFGVCLFGHHAAFIDQAIQQQLLRTGPLGTRASIVGEVAELFTEITGHERCVFSNTGTEAVMAAIRMARAATGRSKIVIFEGSYHGHSDTTALALYGVGDQREIVPVSPGIPENMADNVLILDYDQPASLQTIREHAHEIAGVMVEAVQSRAPGLQARQFLLDLRELTAEIDVPLIFDEMITGFRLHPQGAQGWFGVKADMATYGKAVGGGMPIGVVAGRAKYLDGIDGGFWQYGDNSFPEVERTFFGGTFCQHPLSMAAARVILQHIKAAGMTLYEQLNRRTADFAQRVNHYFAVEAVPFKVVHCGSLFRFEYTGNLEIFFYHLLNKGIYVGEWRSCFVSTAHTDADLEQTFQAIQESIESMRDGGFLPPGPLDCGCKKKTAHHRLESSNVTTLEGQEEKHFPLTTAQSQLWLLNQLGKQSSLAYHERIMARLQGRLDQQALQVALQQLLDRHESLRLRFSVDGLTQIVQAQASIAIHEYELTPDAVDAWLEAENQQAFDFTQGPLFRVALLTLPADEHRLVFTAHHIITDGFSLDILVEELASLYTAQVRQQAIRMEPARQYSDYVAWLAQQQQGDQFKEQLAYWRGQLADPPTLLLPADRLYPTVRSHRGGSHTHRLDAQLTEALNRLARQNHGTTFMVALSAYLIFLHRLCNQYDLVVGVPTTGRGMEAGDTVVGYCTHLLPVRSQLAAQPEPAFVDYFNQLKNTLFDAYDHSDYPYADLLNNLDIPRDAIRPPLVSCIFNLDKPGATPNLPGLQMEFLPTTRQFFHFDLGLNITELENGWEASWIYNADIFEASTIRRWAENFTTLLTGISENPDRSIYALPLLTEDEQRQLQTWNQTATDYPRDQTIVSLFEGQVRTTPGNVAVVFESQSLTYAELNSRVNRVAHALMALGVRVDTLVGLCVDRSVEMVVGLLGILKAGGAYVPLDPAYPEKRLRYMLDDCGAKLLLAQSHLQGMLGPLLATKDQRGERRDIEMLSLDTIDLSSWPDSNPTAKVTHDGLAYVIYTSGSTGNPKGVLSHHQGLYNLAKVQMHAFGVLPKSRVLQFASLSFDASVFEWAMALGVGASLYLASRDALMPGDALQSTLNRHLITHVCLPPTALNMMSADACPHLANLIVAGEACPVELAKQWSVGRRFFNAYGPTETTVCATVAEYSPLDDRLAIGKPLANLRVYVLNGQGNPMPIGVPGELCIAGVGMARGYLNQPELTAEKFVELELFCQHERLYRTGDLARWLPDGNLEYLGRIDHQIKLRGFRIELGEIEAVLTHHPAINTAVVVLHERDGNKSLAAYLVFAADKEATDITALRNWLSDRLPDYMIPASFSVLDALPLTPNGKIDRKALPEPGGLLVAGRYELPRSGTEQQLADIWAAVLNRPAIGIHDNFFELGGDSILSIQIVARARQAGLGINPHDVFQHQTVAKLAQVVQPASAVQAEQGLVQGSVSLTPIQSWFLGSDTPEPWHFNQAMLLTVPENLHEAALEQALAALLRHHDALRLRYQQAGDGWWQIHAAPDESRLPFHSEVLPAADWEAALETRSTHWQASLDLTQGPLSRMVLFRASQTGRSPSLLWVIHHLAVDGVSWRILLDDLHTAYQQAKEGQPIQLPPKSSSFQAWAEHLRQWTGSTAFTADAAYWHTLPDTVASLPKDYPHGSNRVADTCHHILMLDANATRQLLEEAPAAYRTGINDLLLSALLLALQEWGGGQRQHLIDLESHGRAELFPDLDLSRTVGWFTSLHTVDLTLPDSPDLAQVIQSVKEQLRRIPHEGVAYGLLRQQGVVLPKSSVLFNYLGQFDQTSQQGGFSVIQDGSGRSHSLGGSREHVLEINGIAVHGQLELAFSYSGAQYKESTIQHLANRYQYYLQTLLAHCQTHYGYTPADFPLACLDQTQVDSLTRLYQRNLDTVYPLTPMQQGMMFHTLYAPDSGLYFEQVACLITGEIHPATLRAAWQWLVNRHSVLRTAFYHDGLQSLQIVCREAQVPWQDIDWQSLSVDEQRRQRQQLMAQERQRGFDLVQAPLMRFHLIRETADRYRLVWHHHHILLDGWCLPILFREMSLVYAALLRQQLPSLPPAQDYGHFIAWLTQQDQNAARHYWQEKLAGFSSPTPIPLSRQGLTEKTLDPKQVRLSLPAVTNQRIHYLARQRRVTTNTLVLTAWAILLGRYSGESDVVFGATTSGRNVPLAGIENRVGLFINTLPLRVKLKGNPVDLSHTLQNQQQADNQYAYTGLADIQSWSETPNGTALFDSLVVFENYPDDDSPRHQQGLPLRFSEVEAIEQTNYLLTLAVTVLPGEQLSFDLGFDANRIQPEMASRILGHLEVLLTGIADHPEADIHALSLLTVAEQQQLTVWNQTAVDYPQDQTIVSLFERQVKQTPCNTALRFESQSLTYAELNGQANQLAHHLSNLKNTDGSTLVTGNRLVAIAAERSFDMVVGLLGILKAGCAYVPIDPSYPPSRIQYMLEDSAATVLLTQNHVQAQLPLDGLQHECTVLCLDEMDLSAQPSSNLAARSKPEDLAYVIYTSGSTGKPKGTLLTHQGLGNYLQWAVHYYEVANGNGAPVQSSIGFDATITSLYLPLISGSPVVLLPEHEEIEALVTTLRQGQQYSLVKITPAHLEILNHQLGQNEYLNASNALVLGGEALMSAHIRPWLRYAPDTHLMNEYGPTETVVGCCIYDAKGQTMLDGAIPIGKPIANTRIYILDVRHQPQPPGIPGELCIAGAGLARGYLNRPELTAEKFMEVELFGKVERIYKTGDLARWLPDGNLEYLGRIDYQIKLRGFRIELGEIESSLAQHPAVSAAVVAVHERNGSKSLAAYVTLKDGQEIKDTTTLRTWLSAQLPDYMVPAAFVILSAFPLTPNGKIDRKSLPEPDYTERQTAYKTPLTETEKKLAGLFSAVLSVGSIGVDENFFELGGDSIISIQLVSRARQEGLHFTPKDVFQNPTIAGLAIIAGELPKTQQANQGILVGEVPLLPIQQAFFAIRTKEPHHFNQSTCYLVPANLNLGHLTAALQQLLVHHDALRAYYRHTDEGWQQWIAAPAEASASVRHIAAAGWRPEQRLAHLAEVADQLQADLNLAQPALMRLAWFDYGKAEPGHLVWVVHHLIVDAVSWRILVEDLNTLYRQLQLRQALALPAKTHSYADWANYLRAYARSERMPAQLAYWEDLAQQPATELPCDHAYRAENNTVASTRDITIIFDPQQTEALLETAPKAYRTRINDLLLTALVMAMQSWHGASSLLLDLESHGRHTDDETCTLDLSRTVGWFTSIYPVHLQLASDQISDNIKAIKEQLRSVPDQGLSYGPLRHFNRQLTALPTAQLLFNYLGRLDNTTGPSAGEGLILQEISANLGHDHSLLQQREYLLEINGWVGGGQLQFIWTYSREIHTAESIGRLAQAFQQALHKLIEHCLSDNTGGFTPSDFTLANLNQRDLDEVLAALDDL